MQQNFVCAIEDNARRFPSKTAIICAGKKLSWSDLDDYAAGFAQHLSRQSIAAGDRVAILLPNGLEFVIGSELCGIKDMNASVTEVADE